jgi:hypothetical protein
MYAHRQRFLRFGLNIDHREFQDLGGGFWPPVCLRRETQKLA